MLDPRIRYANESDSQKNGFEIRPLLMHEARFICITDSSFGYW